MATRKQSILDAALVCVTEWGVEATTIEMIRERSGASIGSLYHHFGSKERLLAELYLAGITDYASQLQAALDQVTSLEQWVKTVVGSYLDWVQEHPDWARFLLHNRGRVEAGGELEEPLNEANRQHQAIFRQRLLALGGVDALKPMPYDCLLVILLGPTQELARRWLAGRLANALADCKAHLCEAAWQSLRTPG